MTARLTQPLDPIAVGAELVFPFIFYDQDVSSPLAVAEIYSAASLTLTRQRERGVPLGDDDVIVLTTAAGGLAFSGPMVEVRRTGAQTDLWLEGVYEFELRLVRISDAGIESWVSGRWPVARGPGGLASGDTPGGPGLTGGLSSGVNVFTGAGRVEILTAGVALNSTIEALVQPYIEEAVGEGGVIYDAIGEGVTAVNAAGSTQVSAVNAAGTTKVAAVNTAGDTQVSAVNSAGGTQVSAVNAAGTTKVDAVNTAGTTQVAAVNSAGGTQVTAVGAAGTTQVGLVDTAGGVQVAAVNAAGDGLVADVEAAGATQVGLVNTAGTTQVAAVNSAGGTQVTAVGAAGTTQVGAVNSAGGTQVTAVEAAGTTQVGLVNAAGGTQLGLINAAGDGLVDAVEAAGTTQVAAVNTAGTTQVGLVNAAGDAILDPTVGTLPAREALALDAVGLAVDAVALRFETWALLNAVAGTTAGQAAKVHGPDAGSHTDPVVGGTKANMGVYRWSTSPAGWKWLVALDADSAAASAAAAAASATTATAMQGSSAPALSRVPLIMVQGKDALGLNADPTHFDFGEMTWRGGAHGGGPRRQRRRRLLPTAIPKTDRYHVLGYGQSNDLGLDATPVLTSTPSIRHLTFNVGIRATKPGITGGTLAHDGAEKYLVETATSTPEGTGYETKHSTAAREAWRLCMDAGVGSPRFFCSSAGKGSQKLATLKPSATWYGNLRYHWQAAKALATTAGHSYALPFIVWDHCEFDQQDNTSKASYKADMITLITTVAADVLTDTGYAGPIYWLCSLTDHQIATSHNAADALIELAAERSDVFIYAQGYPLPAVNSYHRSNVGQALKGAYLGRAMADMLAGFKPECWTWGRARANGTTLYVSFDAPSPGQFDTTIYPKVTDFGIKVVDDTGTLTLSNMVWVGGYTLQITLNRTLGTNPVFRYGLDFIATGVATATSAGGNIADMSARDVTISTDTFAIVHAAPPCALTIEASE